MAARPNTIRAFLLSEEVPFTLAQAAALTALALLVLGSRFAGTSPWQGVATANSQTIVENLALPKRRIKTGLPSAFQVRTVMAPLPRAIPESSLVTAAIPDRALEERQIRSTAAPPRHLMRSCVLALKPALRIY